ncbi:hypothetical protein MNEG_4291 [Monoraphidium neglectum]|uniref:Uncharacterized protein n=1 Tax=Monoraphidium neglectum TaxID=145388 RepID=A0A0D2MTC1_9CHLO|nr:hypothetical protein MNEG_4291 [Monoraphidium neglectum]KIZ03672.1 hypothetical protein MNEG_4291 [Monoraphidium neglectum]|eukprot:XP_013902691.1 hypothetical protein MNEG_4291 [Monoraphidium neglectum]
MAQQNGTPGAPQLLSGGAAAAQPQAPPAAAPQPPQPPQPPAADQANGAGSGAPRGPLIGRAGFLHISESLKKDGPDRTIADMQRLHGLSHPLCRPLLELTDHLQLAARQRSAVGAAAAASAANDARQAALAAREEEEVQGRLEALLGASFAYLGMPELKQIPLEVLNSMERVPAPFLKLLAEDREVFNSLPQRVKQQVWEYDKGLLQSVAIETIATYKYEAATLLSCLDMRQFAAAPAAARPCRRGRAGAA